LLAVLDTAQRCIPHLGLYDESNQLLVDAVSQPCSVPLDVMLQQNSPVEILHARKSRAENMAIS